MLILRFARSGRANSAFFRVVLTEKSKPCDSGFIKILGWYNPHTKKVSLEKEAILEWIDKGAGVSNSVAKLLIAQGIEHKRIKFIPDAPKAKKGKKSGTDKPKDLPQPEKATDKEKAESPVAEKVEERSTPETQDESPARGDDTENPKDKSKKAI